MMADENKHSSLGCFKRELAAYDTEYWYCQFIVSCWPTLAAAAWAGYEEAGRGVVFIHLSEADDPGPEFPYFYAPLSYAPLVDLWQDLAGRGQVLLDGLNQYGPSTEFMVAIESLDGTCHFKELPHFEGLPYPQEAFEIYRALGADEPPERIHLIVTNDAALEEKATHSQDCGGGNRMFILPADEASERETLMIVMPFRLEAGD